MKIITDRFGEIEFDDSIIINLEDGIIGFENLKQYILITESESLFSWFTALEQPQIMFPLFPALLMDENFPTIDKYDVFGIVRLAKEIGEITINMKAPLYLNLIDKVGYQKIIDNDKYEVSKKLFIESKE
jgi:flagellar assembly factor FliW